MTLLKFIKQKVNKDTILQETLLVNLAITTFLHLYIINNN